MSMAPGARPELRSSARGGPGPFGGPASTPAETSPGTAPPGVHVAPKVLASPVPECEPRRRAEDALVDLAVRHASKTFGGRSAVLEDVSMAIRRGESVALIGANGAGKSTLLRCCVRLVEPDSGSITLLGREISGLGARELRRVRARVGFVFQRHNLVPRLSVLTNVIHGALGGRGSILRCHESLAPANVRDEALACLEHVGLADRASRRADRLSGGESQRVAIARALMQRPRLLLADEPAASLDPRVGEEVMELFRRLVVDRGFTLLFTSHNLEHALRFSNRVLGLRGGRIEIDAPASGLDRADLGPLYG